MKRILIHIPIGLIIAFLSKIDTILPLCFTILFLIYEVNEDKHLNDNAYKDISGALIGLGIGGIILFYV